ncbi:MAG: F0F1 ATP synthase subunit B [Balneolaceae bacterium]|nr:F0F1 ATP synthase subunit B [Balneolaceae bacterium]
MLHFLAGGGGLLSFNTGFGIWVAISTLVFLFLMNKYLVPPIMKALNERETRIKESLESAEKALAKAEQVSKDNEKALREAELKAQKIRKQALEDAELMRSEKIEKAKEEAEKILSNARETIEQEKKRALVELRNEVAELAVKSAGMIIQSELDQAKNKKLVDSFINDLSKQN